MRKKTIVEETMNQGKLWSETKFFDMRTILIKIVVCDSEDISTNFLVFGCAVGFLASIPN